MTMQTINITNLTTLGALKTRGSLLRPIRGRVILKFPTLDARELRQWQRALTRDVFACGCGVGTWMAINSVILFTIWRVIYPNGPLGITWMDIPLIFLVFTTGLMLGKALGLLIAGRTLNHKKTQLHALLCARTTNKEG
ncbi:MAG: hypothetical protein V3V13_05800 [Paracoccaceae bacterium]